MCPQMYRCDMISGTSVVSGLYFPSFVLISTFVMLNLVIAVILDNFIESAQSEGLLKVRSTCSCKTVQGWYGSS